MDMIHEEFFRYCDDTPKRTNVSGSAESRVEGGGRDAEFADRGIHALYSIAPSFPAQIQSPAFGLIQLPVDDVPGVPVDDGKQVHPAVLHPDIGNFNRPHLILLCDV